MPTFLGAEGLRSRRIRGNQKRYDLKVILFQLNNYQFVALGTLQRQSLDAKEGHRLLPEHDVGFLWGSDQRKSIKPFVPGNMAISCASRSKPSPCSSTMVRREPSMRAMLGKLQTPLNPLFLLIQSTARAPGRDQRRRFPPEWGRDRK